MWPTNMLTYLALTPSVCLRGYTDSDLIFISAFHFCQVIYNGCTSLTWYTRVVSYD